MQPAKNPPPDDKLITAKTAPTIEYNSLDAGLSFIVKADSRTKQPITIPTAERVYSTAASLPFEPGKVGITWGNQIAAAPNRAALAIIKVPEIKENR